jgi:hypothetical protein
MSSRRIALKRLDGFDIVGMHFSRNIARVLDIDGRTFESKVRSWAEHLNNYYLYGAAQSDSFYVVELGTGWWPILPIGLILYGAKKIFRFDVAPLITEQSVKQAIQLFCDYDRRENSVASYPACGPNGWEFFMIRSRNPQAHRGRYFTKAKYYRPCPAYRPNRPGRWFNRFRFFECSARAPASSCSGEVL